MNKKMLSLIICLVFIAGAVNFAIKQDWLFSLFFLAISALFAIRFFQSGSNG